MARTMTDQELVDTVRRLAAEQVNADPAEVTSDTHLFNDLSYDSLDAVDFTMRLEEEFQVMIDDAQAEGVRTVGAAVEALRAACAAPPRD